METHDRIVGLAKEGERLVHEYVVCAQQMMDAFGALSLKDSSHPHTTTQDATTSSSSVAPALERVRTSVLHIQQRLATVCRQLDELVAQVDPPTSSSSSSTTTTTSSSEGKELLDAEQEKAGNVITMLRDLQLHLALLTDAP